MSRIAPEIETSPDVLFEDAVEYLRTNVPGYEPSAGNLEVWLLMTMARMAAEVRDIASDVPDAIFKFFGNNLVGIAPILAARSSFDLTFTTVDDAGYTVPAGTVVNVRGADGTLVSFATREDVPVTAGDTVSAAATVYSVDPGVDTAGLDVTTTTLTLVDSLAYIDAVTPSPSPTVTSGGADEEDDDVYLGRLANELTLLTPRPILPRDFEILAMRQTGVYRALALDGFNPDDDTYDNERMIAIAAIDSDGAALDVGVASDLEETLDAMREVNFVVNVIEPDYTTINVTTAVHVFDEWDPDDVKDRVEDALTDWLNPAVWASDTITEGLVWRNESKVRYLEVAQVINNVDGVDYIVSLTVNAGTSDVTMTGAAPLPEVGTITVTNS